ncbi:DNA-directed RNA polymerase III subunit RPC7 isoform X1 [Stigmatopora nigra]
MAGKGRGVAAFTFNIEALGIGRGSMPEARVGPSPLFPPTDFKPVPLKVGEDMEYMLALKQEMRGVMQRMPRNLKFQTNKRDLEKYTERYLKEKQKAKDEWIPDWNVFPKELMPQNKTDKKAGPKKKRGKISSKAAKEVLNKLDELEKKGDNDKSDEEKPKNKENEGGGGDEEEEIEEEEYEEEEVEDNDYIDNYFDNGEDFAAGSDDNMDGEATY